MFTLPANFRPAQQESFVVNANGAFGVVNAYTNGQVALVVGTGTSVSLTGIMFSTT